MELEWELEQMEEQIWTVKILNCLQKQFQKLTDHALLLLDMNPIKLCVQ